MSAPTVATARKSTNKQEAAAVQAVPSDTVISVKGFGLDLKCLGFQYEIGKTFDHPGKVVACPSSSQVAAGEGGFHACEYPLDVFNYYEPATSRYALVTQSGDIARHADDTKIASARITIDAEIKIPELVTRAFNWVLAQCIGDGGKHTEGDQSASSATGYQSASSATGYQSASSATGDRSASSATGYQSASSATGYQSASSATGDRSASSATGDRSASSATGDRSASSATGDRSASSATGYRSASSATGDRSASSATGDRSASSATGDRSASSATGYRSASSATGIAAVALNTGIDGKAKAAEGGAICLCFHDDSGNLVHIRAGKIGDNGLKPDTFYSLSATGEFVEVAS